jgi:hypothetical protein
MKASASNSSAHTTVFHIYLESCPTPLQPISGCYPQPKDNFSRWTLAFARSRPTERLSCSGTSAFSAVACPLQKLRHGLSAAPLRAIRSVHAPAFGLAVLSSADSVTHDTRMQAGRYTGRAVHGTLTQWHIPITSQWFCSPESSCY